MCSLQTRVLACEGNCAVRWPLLLFLLLGCGRSADVPAPPDRPDQVWVQLGPDGALVRSATIGPCPVVLADRVPLTLSPRASTPPDGFTLQVCEAPISPGTRSLVHELRPLPLPRPPRRIVLVGDTGCRMKSGSIQNCSGEGEGPAWSFDRVAAGIGAERPDLVVHLGDYHYREAPCPRGDLRCAGLARGYNGPTWQQDFLDPARPMLEAAPLLAIRGNHEDCDRAWRGWFWFLDPHPLQDPSWATCPERTPSFTVDTPELQLLALDSATVRGWKKPTPNADEVAAYRTEFEGLQGADADRPAWLVTHRPPWALTAFGPEPLRKVAVVERTLQYAGAGTLPVQAAFGGHLHVLQAVPGAEGHPPSFVSGGGGTSLSTPLTPELIAQNPDALAELGVDGVEFHYEVGWMVAERQADAWTITAKSLGGATLFVRTLPDPPTGRPAPPGTDPR